MGVDNSVHLLQSQELMIKQLATSIVLWTCHSITSELITIVVVELLLATV